VNDRFIIPEKIIIIKEKKRNYINNINYYDKDDKTSEWLYDTGAGKHNNFTWLNNYIHFKKKDVQMGRCVAVKENTKIDYNNKIQ